ncbi:PIR protein [Plasmodium vivax]|uniref:VIR protein n=1 Tax=Plasmodium vivax TaxID=5855 RepID=A0A564ZN71_PLAVI|nr:PIR protein [Plasmodium vivax]
MEECRNHAGDYLTYRCYTELNYYFNKIVTLSDESEEKLRNVLSNMTYRNYDMRSIPLIFKKIGTFFTGDKAFAYSGQKPSCIYVNYWLNNELNKSYYNERKYEFDVFKDFANKFTRVRGRTLDNSCSSYMEDYNEVKWKRIKILYELYDKFEKFMSSKKYNTLQCYEINFLRNIFNEFINNNDGKDDELMDKLIKFKELLKKNPLLIKAKCQNEINHFKSPEQYLHKKNQEREKAAQEKAAQEKAAQEKAAQEKAAQEKAAQEKAAQAEEERAKQLSKAGEERAQLQTDQKTLLKIPPNSEQTLTLTDASGIDLLLETQRRTLEIRPSKRHEDSEGQKFTDPTQFTSKPLRVDQESLEYTEIKNTVLENANMHQSITPGVFGTLKNTITDVLGEVDPVPVVGVSGGMGALFLLFRYTPVGTFFRGSRRRQRIPNRFYGEYPEFFPGFQGYGDGYFPNDRFNIAYGAE